VTAVAWAAKGELSFNERVPEYDVRSATAVAPSPDGNNLYVTGGSQVTVLSRTAATGAFSYVETETDGVDDLSDPGAQVNGLSTATAAATGKVEVPKGNSKKAKAYKLAEVSKGLLANDKKTLKLKPKKSKDKRKIAGALKHHKKVKAKIEVTITDDLGNKVVESKTVKLKAK
jgi:hypothetical protein